VSDAPFQRFTLVARAIVQHEIAELRGVANGGGGGFAILTVPRIVNKYALRWGAYHHGDDAPPRADQLIRNELNRAREQGLIKYAEDEFGFPVKDGRWRAYTVT
jgi:hypothetical protein